MTVIVGIIALSLVVLFIRIMIRIILLYYVITFIVIPVVLSLSFLGFSNITNWLLNNPYEPFFFIVGWVMLAFWLYILIRILLFMFEIRG